MGPTDSVSPARQDQLCRWQRSSYPSVCSVLSLKWQCQPGDQQWYLLLPSTSSKRMEQQALVTWSAFELESYVVLVLLCACTAASSFLPYLQLKNNLSCTQTWKFIWVVHCPDFFLHVHYKDRWTATLKDAETQVQSIPYGLKYRITILTTYSSLLPVTNTLSLVKEKKENKQAQAYYRQI